MGYGDGNENKKLKSAAFRSWREEGDDLFYFVAAAVNLYRKLKQNIYNLLRQISM